MLHTDICDLFGIEYPIVLAGMGGVSMAPLVAAVSNAGGSASSAPRRSIPTACAERFTARVS
jgi:NAD(P)H-dependent flavin oxidoreductase YrpB (nitropropane dioxygenase family)